MTAAVYGPGVGKRRDALAAGFDSSVRSADGVIRLALEPPIPYDKRLIWRTAEPLPAPVRALLSILRKLCAAPGTPTGTHACTPGSPPHVKADRHAVTDRNQQRAIKVDQWHNWDVHLTGVV